PDAQRIFLVLGQPDDVVVDDLALEAAQPARDLLADVAQPHDADHLALQLVEPRLGKSPTRHLPAVTLLCCQWSFFIVARISITACSATATELAPPLLATGTRARRAASRSTVL